MRRIFILLCVLCCMIVSGCNNEEQSGVTSDKAQPVTNTSRNEDICKEILNSYLVQQVAFDNTKIRDLNSHIVSITNIADREFSGFLTGKETAQMPLSDLMLDRTTDREILRDYICHIFLIPTVAIGARNDSQYKKIFTRSDGDEIADWYINLYSLTKFDIQTTDSVQDKGQYMEAFKSFIKDVDSNEIYFFKISTEYIDFNSINNQITKRIINEFIKDKKIILSNERIKNRKAEPPTTLDEFWKIVPISSISMPSGNDIQYIHDKTKQIFIDVLKDNMNAPQLIKNDFYVCMYGKPLLEYTQKIFLVSAISDTINKPLETRTPTGGVRRSDKTINVRPFIFTDLDEYIWKDFIGNISNTRENILFDTPKKIKPNGPTLSVLSAKPTNGSDKQHKYYKLNISLSNDTSKDIKINTSVFELRDGYDDFIGSTTDEGSMAWVKKDKVGIEHNVGYIYKSDYDKFTDDELDMLTGEKDIPPQKTFEFTKIISLHKDRLTADEVWLTFRDSDSNYYWETKLEIK